jgi:hypothetical protein
MSRSRGPIYEVAIPERRSSIPPIGITGIISTKNEAHRLPWSYPLLAAFCDEVLVVDMESTDDTVQVAQALGAKVLPVPNMGFADPARQVGIDAARNDWIFLLDADELVPPALGRTLQALAASDLLDALWIARRNFMFGREITSAEWWPDYQLRFFRRGTVSFRDVRLHEPPPAASGARVRWMPLAREAALVHFNYTTVSDFVERLNRYTNVEAQRLHEEGRSGSVSQALETVGAEIVRRLRQVPDGDEWGVTLSFLMGFYRLTSWAKTRHPSVDVIQDLYRAVREQTMSESREALPLADILTSPGFPPPITGSAAVELPAAFSSAIQTLEHENRDFREWIRILQQERDVRSDRIADLERELASRDAWIPSLQNDLGLKDDRIRDLEATVDSRDGWVRLLQDEIAQLKGRVSDQEAALAPLEREVEELRRMAPWLRRLAKRLGPSRKS